MCLEDRVCFILWVLIFGRYDIRIRCIRVFGDYEKLVIFEFV